MSTAHVDRNWDQRYREGDTPWDSGIPSRELRRVLREHGIGACRALELGCGSGTNAVYLAMQGFDVTAVDCSPGALAQGREKAAAANVAVQWIEQDVQNFGADSEPFDFVFDRGCYHCCRRVDLEGYRSTLRNVTRPGTLYLSLAGNVNEQSDAGIPKVTEQEIRSELGGLFEIISLRAFRFEDAGGIEGPLGWSTLMRRKSNDRP